MDYPKRKNPRLAAFDYSAPNVYFLTLCTRGRNRCLSRIVGRGLDPAVPRPGSRDPSAVGYALELTPFGRIAEQDLLDLPRHFDGVTVLQYVIMPDHIHILLQLDAAGPEREAKPRPHDDREEGDPVRGPPQRRGKNNEG